MVNLDVISDPICPWCLIGKSRLDAALAERPGHPFRITWRPFQLNPDMPEGGMDRQAYFNAKFGSPARAAEVYRNIAQAAEADGLNLALDRIRRTPNTLNAHRLLRWARAGDAEEAVISGLFERYFRRGEDIGRTEVLLDIAGESGLDRAVIARLLATDADRAETLEEESVARRMGINGVPTYIIDGRSVLTGAQPPAQWLRVIDALAATAPA